MKVTISTVVLMLIVIGMMSVLSTKTHAIEDNQKTVGLTSSDKKERDAACNSLLQERATVVNELIAIVKDKDTDKAFNGPLHYAIALLGKMRAVEAIPVLTEKLYYIPTGYDTDESNEYQEWYVAAPALIQIGEPAIPSMMEIIRKDTDQNHADLATWVILKIEGKEQAKYRLKQAAEKSLPDKTAYENAMRFIDTYKYTPSLPPELRK